MANVQEPVTHSSWPGLPGLSLIKTTSLYLGQVIGLYAPVKSIPDVFPTNTPRPIHIENCRVAPCSYPIIKTHALKRLEEEKDREDAINTCNIDVLRRGVINNTKALLEDDNLQGLVIHYQNFNSSFSAFPYDQILEEWDEFTERSESLCKACDELINADDMPGLLAKIPELKEIYTDIPIDNCYRTWKSFIASRQRELDECQRLLKDQNLQGLEERIQKLPMSSITLPKGRSTAAWQEQIQRHQVFLSDCQSFVENNDMIGVMKYAKENPDIYRQRPDTQLKQEWQDFIRTKRQEVQKPVFFDEKFEAVTFDDNLWKGAKEYDALLMAIQHELLNAQSRIFTQCEDPNDPQIIALKNCAQLIEKKKSLDTLFFEVRNYNFLFGPLFENFPFDQLKAAYLDSKGITEEEFAPKNLGELRNRFAAMSTGFARDMDKKTKQFNPNSRVFSQIMATRCLGENEMQRFIDVYQRSLWLQAVFPPEFMDCIIQTHLANQAFDAEIQKFLIPLDKYNRNCSRDRVVSTRRACVMQKNKSLYLKIDTQLRKEARRLGKLKDDEELAAKNEGRPNQWNQEDDQKLSAAQDALELFAADKWEELTSHLKENLPEFYQRKDIKCKDIKCKDIEGQDIEGQDIKSLLGRLVNETRQDVAHYWPQIVATRLAITGKACAANGTEQDFLKMCLTSPEPKPFDHWTNRLQRREYQELTAALQEARSYEKGVEETIETALQKYMPLEQET